MDFSELGALTYLVLLALILAQSVWHKVNDYGRFLGLVANYRLVPGFLEEGVSRTLIALEALLVVLLVFPATAVLASLSGGVLLLVYAAAMGINLLRGRQLIDCGCGGRAQPVSWLLVLRNLTLALLALLPAIFDAGEPSKMELTVALLAGAVLWLTYNLAGQVIENNRLLSSLRQF
ncbi:MauE/DoxX family redox-associated membrane protein [Halomonas sp. BC1]|uniref:MauE/DoxX family redox-associated membrane protein n=1 Tax=Halomonas sp. BC1 TaxID=1670448 RepID=UPI0009BF2195|nr:MauE/DoxX family redox-associated membrane protein [Halomonas sp. BC1]